MKTNSMPQIRLQAYLTGLATTTGLVASSGAVIVNINIDPSSIGLPNANLGTGQTTVVALAAGLPNLQFYISSGGTGVMGYDNKMSGLAISNLYYSGAGIAFTGGLASPQKFAPLEEIGGGGSLTFNIFGYPGYGAFRYQFPSSAPFQETPEAFGPGPGSYLGFTDGEGHYGWLEVTWDPTLGPDGTFEIIRGAFETELDKPIHAGDTGLTAVPEPGNLLALSGLVGSAMFLRSRRKAAAKA